MDIYDIIIIGAGPAGLTAALYALRAGKSVLVIEKGVFGGQMTFSPKIENFPSAAEISGSELADKMVEQVLSHGADFEMDRITEIITDNGIKKAVGENGEYGARAVIIASGAAHRHLGIEREEEFIGSGISFCAVCDGAFYSGQTVIVAGGGNSAMQEALLLSKTSKRVIMVQNLSSLTGEGRLAAEIEATENIEVIFNSVVEEILGGDTFKGIKIKNTVTGEVSETAADGMFVAIGLVPETGCFKNLVALDEYGYIDADESCVTSVPGIFTAGDCRRKTVRQITTAAADGAVAALAASRYTDNTEKKV